MANKALEKFRSLFYPESVAVIGASNNPFKLGFHALAAVTSSGFKGKVYPVNPRAGGFIQGLPAYPDIHSIPSGIDLYIYAVPDHQVLPSLRASAERGAKAGVIFAGGFREVGETGQRMQEEMIDIANAAGIKLIGPNCIGFFNNHAPINATFASPLSHIQKGGVSVVSQSGGMGTGIISQLEDELVGVSKFVSVGNRANVDFADMIEYLAEDPHTKVICLFIEGLDRAREFLLRVRSSTQKKPVLVCSFGYTEKSSMTALSHTGSMASSEGIYRGAFAQSGIFQLEDSGRMVRLAKTLEMVGPLRGNGVFMATHTAGPAIVIADLCERAGVKIPDLKPEIAAEIQSFLPPYSRAGNPLDMFAQAWTDSSLYIRSTDIALRQDNVFCALAIYGSGLGAGPIFPSEEFAFLARKHEKPALLCLIAPYTFSEEARYAQQQGVPTVNSPEHMGYLLVDLVNFSRFFRIATT